MANSSSNLKKNKNGGTYVNGKSLPLPLRRKIVKRFRKGERVVQIARSMKLTHGVVSKITQHYINTGSILPRNIRSFSDESAAPVPSNAVPSPSESPSSSDADSEEYIDVVSFTPPPVNVPYSVDSILSKPAQPAVIPEPVTPNQPQPSNMPNPICINSAMPSMTMPSVPIIPPLEVIQMAQLLQLQSSFAANQSYPADGNTTYSRFVPNEPMSAVPIIPPLEVMVQLLQLQMLKNQF